MHYLAPIVVILGFSLVLTLGLFSVMQDLLERTAESPLIRENEASLVELVDDEAFRERRTQASRPPYLAHSAPGRG